MANCVPKLVAMATSLSTSGLPSNTWFLGPNQAHNPNGISIGSAVFAQLTAECHQSSYLSDCPSDTLVTAKVSWLWGVLVPDCLVMMVYAYAASVFRETWPSVSDWVLARYCLLAVFVRATSNVCGLWHVCSNSTAAVWSCCDVSRLHATSPQTILRYDGSTHQTVSVIAHYRVVFCKMSVYFVILVIKQL